jgi:hypothetical protein
LYQQFVGIPASGELDEKKQVIGKDGLLYPVVVAASSTIDY